MGSRADVAPEGASPIYSRLSPGTGWIAAYLVASVVLLPPTAAWCEVPQITALQFAASELPGGQFVDISTTDDAAVASVAVSISDTRGDCSTGSNAFQGRSCFPCDTGVCCLPWRLLVPLTAPICGVGTFEYRVCTIMLRDLSGAERNLSTDDLVAAGLDPTFVVTFTSETPVERPAACGNTCCKTNDVCYRFTEFTPEFDACCPAGTVAADAREGSPGTFEIDCKLARPRKVRRFCKRKCPGIVTPHCVAACQDQPQPHRCTKICRRSEKAHCYSDGVCFDVPANPAPEGGCPIGDTECAGRCLEPGNRCCFTTPYGRLCFNDTHEAIASRSRSSTLRSP